LFGVSLAEFILQMGILDQTIDRIKSTVEVAPGMIVGVEDHDSIKTKVNDIIEFVTKLEIDSTVITEIKIKKLIERPYYTYKSILDLLERLRDDIKIGAAREFFFHYPRELALMLNNIDRDWESILSAFPSSRQEIETGVDCYAMGDYSGTVFHMVRIAELGLRTIARERSVKSVGKRKPIEWGTWNDVLQAIEGQLKIVRQATPGPKKDAALNFYDTALSDLRTLQGYRDPTMHFREKYDKGQAYSAMFRTKSLMETLATKLSEKSHRNIKWGL
jgi:hypothetical protein